MQRNLRPHIESLLDAELPAHFRLIHGVDPRERTHQEVLEAIQGRQSLYLIEQRLRTQSALANHAALADDALWMQGALSALLFWARTAQRRRAWPLSISLEVRDYLWREGYEFDPETTWDQAIHRALDYLGEGAHPHLLEEGEAVVQLNGNFLGAGERAKSPEGLYEIGALIARALSHPGEQFEVVSAPHDGTEVHIRSSDEGGTERRLPRHKLWPLGCPQLKGLRERRIQYVTDALAASLSWSKETDVDVEAFFGYHQRVLFEMDGLWLCEHVHPHTAATESHPSL